MAVPRHQLLVLPSRSRIEFGSGWIGRKSNPSNRLREGVKLPNACAEKTRKLRSNQILNKPRNRANNKETAWSNEYGQPKKENKKRPDQEYAEQNTIKPGICRANEETYLVIVASQLSQESEFGTSNNMGVQIFAVASCVLAIAYKPETALTLNLFRTLPSPSPPSVIIPSVAVFFVSLCSSNPFGVVDVGVSIGVWASFISSCGYLHVHFHGYLHVHVHDCQRETKTRWKKQKSHKLINYTYSISLNQN